MAPNPVRNDACLVLLLSFLAPLYAVAQPAPAAPPDLNGVWRAKQNPKLNQPVLLATFQNPPKENLASCLPGGPLISQGLYKFVQTPALLLVIFKDVIGYRQMFLDGRPHPKDADPSWMGHSVGHWEGDTLVVDTVAMNDRTRVQAYPHTEKLHLVERYRRRDRNHLDVQTRIEDPDTFAQPWILDTQLTRAPDQDVLEYVCNDK